MSNTHILFIASSSLGTTGDGVIVFMYSTTSLSRWGSSQESAQAIKWTSETHAIRIQFGFISLISEFFLSETGAPYLTLYRSSNTLWLNGFRMGMMCHRWILCFYIQKYPVFDVMFIKGARWLWAFHERTISLRFLGIILRVLRLEVSVYTMFTISSHFCSRGRGSKIR